MYHGYRIGAVIPAHNEEAAIGQVVSRLRDLPGQPVDRIIVCDNASTDATARRALAAGAEVVTEPRKGYGYACLKASEALPDVDCLVFVDGDNAVDPQELPRVLNAWISGADLAVGSRALGQAEKGSLTLLQRRGNEFAGAVLSRLYGTDVTDLGPFRAIAPNTLLNLNMRTRTYGWTVEMQGKALHQGLRVTEVPVSNAVRLGTSKVSGTWRGSIGAGIAIVSVLACFALARLTQRGSSKRTVTASCDQAIRVHRLR